MKELTEAEKLLEQHIRELLESRTEWDEVAALYYIIGEDLTLHQFQIPDAIWQMAGDPVFVLQMIADSTEHGIKHDTRVPEDIRGLLFRTEAYSYTGHLDDLADQAEMSQVMADHMLHAHPKAVEIRCITAVMTDGKNYLAKVDRPTGTFEFFEGGDATSGRVPDYLWRALLGMKAMKTRPNIEPTSAEEQALEELRKLVEGE